MPHEPDRALELALAVARLEVSFAELERRLAKMERAINLIAVLVMSGVIGAVLKQVIKP